jgi:hypothetical protein
VVEPSASTKRSPALRASGRTFSWLAAFAADDLVLCLFQGASRAAVIKASERLGIPSERLMDSAWLGPGRPAREGPQK